MTVAEQIIRAKNDYDEVYNVGINKGYTIGYQQGKTEGGDTETAYNNGFEAGKQAEYDSIWNGFQNYGKRTGYQFLFYYSGHYTDTEIDFYSFKPKYTLNVRDGRSMFESFYHNLDLSEYLAGDNGLKINFNAVNNAGNMFAFSNITRVPSIKVISGNTGTMFNQSKIETIDGFEIEPASTVTKVSNPFGTVNKLKNLTWNGTISFNGIDLSKAPLLTKASIENVINALSNDTSSLIITLPLTAIKREFETAEGALDGNTSAEWETLIATKSNWTITLN